MSTPHVTHVFPWYILCDIDSKPSLVLPGDRIRDPPHEANAQPCVVLSSYQRSGPGPANLIMVIRLESIAKETSKADCRLSIITTFTTTVGPSGTFQCAACLPLLPGTVVGSGLPRWTDRWQRRTQISLAPKPLPTIPSARNRNHGSVKSGRSNRQIAESTISVQLSQPTD